MELWGGFFSFFLSEEKNPPLHSLFYSLFFLCWCFFILSLFLWKKRKIPTPNIVSTPFFYLAKKSPPSPSDFPTKNWKKTFGYMSLCRYLRSSVMLAGLEVGDHFILNLYNKMTPHQILKYWGFLQNFSFADIYKYFCLQIFAKKM